MRIIILACLFVITTLTHRVHSDTAYTWHDNSGRFYISNSEAAGKSAPAAKQQLAYHVDYSDNLAASPYCRKLSAQLTDFSTALAEKRKQPINPIAEQRYLRQINRLEQKIDSGCRN